MYVCVRVVYDFCVRVCACYACVSGTCVCMCMLCLYVWYLSSQSICLCSDMWVYVCCVCSMYCVCNLYCASSVCVYLHNRVIKCMIVLYACI